MLLLPECNVEGLIWPFSLDFDALLARPLVTARIPIQTAKYEYQPARRIGNSPIVNIAALLACRP